MAHCLPYGRERERGREEFEGRQTQTHSLIELGSKTGERERKRERKRERERERKREKERERHRERERERERETYHKVHDFSAKMSLNI